MTLESPLVRLEPLALEHAEDLHAAGKAETIWRYMPVRPQKTVEETKAWMRQALAEAEAGEAVPFAIIHKEEGKAVGSTRYHDIRRQHRGLEIGWTWLGIDYHRTFVNTHAKYLMLEHAFETLGAIRVQLKTDRRNLQSQKAIERIGAVREGTLRWHYVVWDGHYRDTVMYSIIAKEWPEKKKQLRLRLL